MSVHSSQFQLSTRGKGTYEITEKVMEALGRSGLRAGTVTVFARHTSCSVIIMENADRSARTDLHAFYERIAPEDAPYFTHTCEGPDDMPSHLRMTLTGCSEVVPFDKGRLLLGTWQGLFLFEHRRAAHTREIVVTVMGE